MKRMITTLALAATMVLAMASVALAGPTCAGIDLDPGAGTHFVANHGEHITGDYVNSDDPNFAHPGVRGRANHRGGGVGPGASFCLDQANSKPLPARP